jgi:hypothetical protein
MNKTRKVILVMAVVLVAVFGFLVFANNTGFGSKRADVELARESLINYFDFLNRGEYSKALRYHGGDLEVLQIWSPELEPTNHAALIEAACRASGWQCLKIKEILSEEQVSPNEFKFTVEFAKPDGTTFVLGPCCGATEEEMPSTSEFEYYVQKDGREFRVMTPPVYIP